LVIKNPATAQQLCGFGNVSEFEMRNFASQRNITHAIKQAAVVAVSAPRQQTCGKIACGGASQ
jgi:hypothetical protein